MIWAVLGIFVADVIGYTYVANKYDSERWKKSKIQLVGRLPLGGLIIAVIWTLGRKP